MNQHSQLLFQTMVMAKTQENPDILKKTWNQLNSLLKCRDTTQNIKSQAFMANRFTYFDVPILQHLKKLKPLVTDTNPDININLNNQDRKLKPEKLKEIVQSFEKILNSPQPLNNIMRKNNNHNSIEFYKI